MTNDGNRVISDFFAKWEAETVQWYWYMQRQYRTDYDRFMKEIRPVIGKTNFLIIRSTQLLPRKGCGKSIQEIVTEDMEHKRFALLAKIRDKVGEVLELDLRCGEDGTPNGRVTGTKGTVYINTIIAGGYNIQCAHYRVLVK